MALTLPGPLPALNGKHHTAWRLVFTAAFIALSSGITAAFFLLVPTANNSVRLALDEGGWVFVGAVIVPSGIFSLITLAWGLRIVWRSTEGIPAESR